MGLPFSEYERQVGEVNKHYHECAEQILMYKEGILPLDPDEDEQEQFDGSDGANVDTTEPRRRHS